VCINTNGDTHPIPRPAPRIQCARTPNVEQAQKEPLRQAWRRAPDRRGGRRRVAGPALPRRAVDEAQVLHAHAWGGLVHQDGEAEEERVEQRVQLGLEAGLLLVVYVVGVGVGAVGRGAWVSQQSCTPPSSSRMTINACA
jgi:hypothetical protein